MKLLHREDVIEAGYDLPNTGLFASIGEFELEELKFGGEWVLAENEVLVTDGHEQRYLYMLVSGEVAITKKNDQGNSQQIATLSAGAAFGEMAFLSGGVASADVQSIGECILWRIDHERMLEFIGSNGTAGGQLCLNVASILSGRLVDGNKKVVDMGKELQASLAHLQQAASAGTQKDQALKQMQGKVANMQNAFKGSAVQKSKSNWVAVAASAVALLSMAGLIGVFMAGDDSSEAEAAGLADKVVKLEANEEFYLGLKKKLEDENKELSKERKELSLKNESLTGELASKESRSMSDVQGLRDQLSQAKRELSEAKDDIVRARRVTPVQPTTRPSAPVETGKSESEEILAWAKRNTTLIFPCAIKVTKQTVNLQDKAKLAKIPVSVGGALRAMSYHPSSPEYLVVAQPVGNKFLATLPITNSNFVEAVKPKYEKYAKGAGSAGSRMANPLASKPKPAARLSSQLSSAGQPAKSSVPTSLDGQGDGGAPKVAKGRPKGPQKPENVLDQLPAKTPGGSKKKPDLSDHGANCVCKDCRVSKIGKGGSLFPDL
ncbi:MAG: cyclic nucleotide-binding domain-containing protein [Opitutae bacterium]|jgi:CRP-like cAMP-binding protein|nr:cyclic nucleotide-binding domain-containing protein [Opitutae bacterium]